MLITSGQLWQGKQALEALFKLDMELPPKTSYWLSRLKHKIDDEYPVIEGPRMKLLRQYATKTEQGFEIKAGDPNWNDFAQAFNELMAIEIDLPMARRIAIPGECLPDDVTKTIAPGVFLALDPFVEFTFPEDEDEAGQDRELEAEAA